MTSTPMLYRLFSPLSALPQAPLSKCWLGIEYGILVALTIIAFLQAPSNVDKGAVLFTAALVLLTNGWKQHIANGQTYLCIPLFAMLFLVLWQKDDPSLWGLAAGAAAACLVLIRPNTILFFVPFLFQLRRHSRTWLGCCCLPLVLFAGMTLLSPHERSLWSDYFRNISEAGEFNQHPNVYGIYPHPPDPHFAHWEGIDRAAADSAQKSSAIKAPFYSENGNFFVLFRLALHRSLSTASMAVLAVVFTAGLILLYRLRLSPADRQEVPRAAIFGCCLFMIPDLFSPIYRHQYYTVQWILPLLLAATLVSTRNIRWFVVLLVALLLNVIHLPFIKMENTIGEYGWLLTLAALSLTPGRRTPSKQGQARLSPVR
jgi:hypothetical protein